MSIEQHQPNEQQAPAGWYADPSDAACERWWTGGNWAQQTRPIQTAQPLQTPGVTPAYMQNKSVGVAYLFYFMLGGFSAHNIYVGNAGRATGFIVLYWTSLFLVWITAGARMSSTDGIRVFGLLGLSAAGVWLLIDLFLVPSYVRNSNVRRSRAI